MRSIIQSFLLIFLCGLPAIAAAQTHATQSYWHGVEREVRYHADGQAFVINNGTRRFNRALYGGPSGFRVEAGDLPEFALYRPRLAGTLKLGVLADDTSKWLINAEHIEARYEAGKMSYRISDSLLPASLHMEVLASRDREGILVRWRMNTPSNSAQLLFVFGGASDERFSREGDIGADPESVFYLDIDHCTNNKIELDGSSFQLQYPAQKGEKPFKALAGRFPPNTQARISDASALQSPQNLLHTSAGSYPVWVGKTSASSEWQYAVIYASDNELAPAYSALSKLFQTADEQRQQIAARVVIRTPDPYLNNLGSALSIAADGIWEAPAYHHGAIAWRQQLVGWRGAYVADPLGWHERARTHFGAYAKSQLTKPPRGPVMPDTSRHLARQVEEIGTAIFTEGYISRYPGGERLRAHHYDMNQVYIDGLLRHLQWTGDLAFAQKMWPVIKRHLAWEKRCFDTDQDGLYDAYCSIWASDAVQYSGGGVAHASAYHYYSNTQAAKLAVLLGEDPTPYREEAQRILKALNEQLWLKQQGCYAEFKDLLGLQLLHTSPAIWSVYHTIDSEVPDPLQQYQLLDYVQRKIPRIPIRAKGLSDSTLYTISTTNWMPYTWSVNNVALAEVMHTALAYWQGNRKEDAFLLWKSALMESMYLGASPGSFQQLSFYDAMRGELYRDFADPIGMTTRALVEGLFGIRPSLLDQQLTITPGLPSQWTHASIDLPDLSLAYQRTAADIDQYDIKTRFEAQARLLFRFTPRQEVASISVNGQAIDWELVPEATGRPLLQISPPPSPAYQITIAYKQDKWARLSPRYQPIAGQAFRIDIPTNLEVLQIHDPQEVWTNIEWNKSELSGQLLSSAGPKTFFVEVMQSGVRWWEAISMDIQTPILIEAVPDTSEALLVWQIINKHSHTPHFSATVGRGNGTYYMNLVVRDSFHYTIPKSQLLPGTHTLTISDTAGALAQATYQNWHLKTPTQRTFKSVDLSTYFNAPITDIFEPQYWSPRPEGPTVQLPVTGIGNWCYPWIAPEIDDSGLRALAGEDQKIELPSGITFRVGKEAQKHNALFVSQWDCFPTQISIPLTGQADHLYLLMAGTTNPMQSRMDNGLVEVTYTDGSTDELPLRNPDNWVPIEQDYYLDGYAFHSPQPHPARLHLKTGLFDTGDFEDYTTIKGFTDRAIEGGAATLLDLELDPDKTLQSLTIKALTNDVVIGLLAATLTPTNH